jgi:hypothetical protein
MPPMPGVFPQVISTGNRLALIWQEFQGESESLDATISIKALFSEDGQTWSDTPIIIAENIPYLWLQEVPLFSAASSSDGRIVVAVAEASEGVALYRQSSPNLDETFIRTALISSGPNAADTPIAPKLAYSGNEFRLFLTRRTAIAGASRPTTLTIFSSVSVDGREWSDPELFINPETDRAVDGAVLEQNFLPVHLNAGNSELVAFQTLRQGGEGQVYQIYVKSRPAGGSWSGAKPVTEELTPSVQGTDPLVWDNQRPHLGLGQDGQILMAWERRRTQERPGISLAELSQEGDPITDVVENVVIDSYTSALPRIIQIRGDTWIHWFDDTGIRIARRNTAYDYDVQALSLNSQTPGSDRNSAAFPYSARLNGEVYLVWQDRAGGLERVIFLRPDLRVDSPILRNANFSSGRPGNIRTLIIDWTPPQDSSGVLSHSWVWSRNPQVLPSRLEIDQTYGESRAVFEIEDPENNEGDWYFALIARDEAGNWSDPLRLSYVLDVTPPPPPTIVAPPTDAYGYLRSNNIELLWDDAESSAAEYYRWRLDYLAPTPNDLDLDALEALSLTDPRAAFAGSDATETAVKRSVWTNLDNGVWAFSVAAVDPAGNQGLPNTKILLTSRYIPVTFITSVTSRKDESDRIILRIAGRGFSVGGLLNSAIIDRDGQEPWDYRYSREGGQLTIFSDRIAEVTGIEDMEEGTYRIGVVHPSRGVVFWNRSMRLDSTGNVKFGPFGLYAYESLWEPAALSIRLSGNEFLLALIVLLGLSAGVIAFVRLASITKDARDLGRNAKALLERGPLSIQAREEAALLLRRKGMGLRRKFTLALTLLVLITIMLIAVVLGFVWIRMERDSLAEGLENESRLLVETLTSSARSSIPAANRGELLLLPDRIGALEDARWTTVTGPRGESVNGVLRATGEGFGYVWATNDPDILDKLRLPATLDAEARRQAALAAEEDEISVLDAAYPLNDDGSADLNRTAIGENRALLSEVLRRTNIMPSQVGEGSYIVDDALSDDIALMRQEVEEAVRESGIDRMISELTILENQYADIVNQILSAPVFDPAAFEQPAYIEAEEAVAAQKKEIETLLLEVSNSRFASYPDFNAEALRSGGPDLFIFYKPLLYRISDQDTSFFRGTVRVAVSVDDIRESLARVQRRIIIITILASLAALAMGIGVAMFISSLMLRPINALVKGVSTIRDQPDMLQHEDFSVDLDTGDELASLADTINSMVRGLVQAALEQKELVAGQEIQKTFLPLEKDEATGKKLSTGGDRNAFFRLFGYYEGADAVSGDYFDFRKLDEDHYVMIKLDIAGHGVTASLIMVQVAALYVDYFRRVRDKAAETGKLDYDLRGFTFGINDLINEVGFRGRFAAFNLSVINVRTAEYEMINAGDNLVNIFRGDTRKVEQIKLPGGPAAGQIDSFMIMNNPQDPDMYKVVRGRLNRGDILFLYTDGIEEAHHILRNKEYDVITYRDFDRDIIGKDQQFIDPTYETVPERSSEEGEIVETPTLEDKIDAALNENLRVRAGKSKYKQINAGQDNEEFDTTRINHIIEAAMNRTGYVLERRCDVTIGKPLHFDFSTLEGTCEDTILALASVEKVFRIIPDTSGGTTTRVRVDKKITAFLKEHFAEYDEFYSHPVDEDEGYVYFSHLREDPQDDDLTLWAYERL